MASSIRSPLLVERFSTHCCSPSGEILNHFVEELRAETLLTLIKMHNLAPTGTILRESAEHPLPTSISGEKKAKMVTFCTLGQRAFEKMQFLGFIASLDSTRAPYACSQKDFERAQDTARRAGLLLKEVLQSVGTSGFESFLASAEQTGSVISDRCEEESGGNPMPSKEFEKTEKKAHDEKTHEDPSLLAKDASAVMPSRAERTPGGLAGFLSMVYRAIWG